MREPQHPVSPEFEKSRDALGAWREQQLAALTQKEQEEYDRIRTEGEKKKDLKAKELQETRNQRITEDKRHRLQSRQDLAYRMLPTKPLKEKRATELARNAITARDARTLADLHQETRKAQDQFLKNRDHQRPAPPEQNNQPLSAAFRRAAQQKAKHELSREDKERGGRER